MRGNRRPGAETMPRDQESGIGLDGVAPGGVLWGRFGRYIITIWLVMVMVIPDASMAQTPPRVLPPAAKPSTRLEQLPPAVPTEVQPGAVAPERAPGRVPAGAENVRFILGELVIEGVTAYPPEEFKGLYADLIGKEISLADVYDIAARIQLRYRQDGYFLTRVFVPAQTITVTGQTPPSQPVAAAQPQPEHETRTSTACTAATNSRSIQIGETTWVINLLSATEKESVLRLAARAESANIRTVVKEVVINGTRYWRLQVPGFDSLSSARERAEVIKDALGLSKVWIFSEGQPSAAISVTTGDGCNTAAKEPAASEGQPAGLPSQSQQGGKVTIRVVEGFISDIQIEGDIGPVQQRVKAYLQNIVGERPIKLATLERYLLLCRDIPGVELDSVLRPAPNQPGAAQLVATVQRKPYDGMAVVDNLGSKFNGEWEVAASGSSNSFTSYGERVTLTGLAGDPPNAVSGDQQNQRVIQLSSSFLAGSKGLYINALGSYGKSRPGSLVSQFDFEDTQLLLGALVGYPIIRTRDLNLTTELGFDYDNSDTDIFSNTKFSRDRLRVLHVSGQMNFLDRWRGSNYLTLGIRKGLSVLDASDSGDNYLSVPDGTGVFTSLQASATRLQPLTDNVALFGNVGGQVAFDTLLSEEQFDVGGLQYGRGYNPDELANDDGVGLTGELQYTRHARLDYLDRYQLFGFYDYGKVWEHSGGASDSLSSAGGGARVWLVENLSVELQVAKPLNRKSQRADDSHDAQLLVRAIGRF